MAGNNFEWSSDQMVENANTWSLAGDVALLNRLKKFSEFLLSETVSVSANVDNLLNNLEDVSVKLDLTKNEFQSLRNTQFIENRVYEDDETLENNENKKEEKELTEEEKEIAIKESIVTGLKVMEKYFERIEVSVSDTEEEEENEKSYILQPKDPYADRHLPYLIGSQEWYKAWHVGLLPSESESESEKEEEVFSSSDSEEPLPKDKNLGSETSSELDFTNRNTGPVANSTFNDSLDQREIFHSSDESSELSNSLPVTTPMSSKSFAEQLTAKLGDVINNTVENVEPHVNRNPIKKMKQPSKYGNMFSDEPPPLDDLEDTVLPKAAHEGLFSRGKDLFGGSTDDELFWDQPNRTSQKTQNSEEKAPLLTHSHKESNLKVSKGLFDQSDSSGDDDMFMAAEKKKHKVVQPYLQPFKTTVPFVDDQPPEIKLKSDSAPSKKKPVGGVSIFGENSNIFSENSGKPGFETSKTTTASHPIQDVKPKSPEKAKKSLKKTSLFDESSDEEVATPQNKNSAAKKPEIQQITKKLSLFDDTDDFSPTTTQDTLKKPEEKKKLGLFGDEDDFSSSSKEDVDKSKENKRVGLFDDNQYQKSDLFKPSSTKNLADKPETSSKTGTENKKSVKKISLFDDDDDFLKEEEDIFASVPKTKNLFDDLSVNVETPRSKGLFEDTDEDTSSKTSANKAPAKSLFDDMETKYSSDIGSRTSEVEDPPEKKKDAGNKALGEDQSGEKSNKPLFDDLQSSGSSEELFGGSKNEKVIQNEGPDAKKETECLFEDTRSSTSAASLPESKKEDIEPEFLDKDSNKSLHKEEGGGRATKEVKDLEDSVEEGLVFNDSDLGQTRAEPGDSKKDILGNRIVSLKPKGASLFEDSDDDFFEVSKNDDVKDKSVNVDSEKSKDQLKEDLFGFEGKKTDGSVRKIKPHIVHKRKIDEDLDKVENSEANDKLNSGNQAEDVLKQNKDSLGNMTSVGLFDSDSDRSTHDNFGFDGASKETKKSASNEKNTTGGNGEVCKEDSLFKSKESKTVLFEEEKIEPAAVPGTKVSQSNVDIGESSSQHEEMPYSHASTNYNMPPPIDLFDPTPPPLDWDAGSDNSGDSDTFSLSDGLLNQTNFTQSQTRSSLFDEAPPSLDVNESSGIVRDMNVTRVEADDSSFYPYASSSRRLSSDIFGEEQSQDSFFVTKNRTESSTQPGANLKQIPENVENMSSKIENLTPSGNIGDFEESSVFEKIKNESKDSENMDNTTRTSEIKEIREDSLFGDETRDGRSEDIGASKALDSIKKKASLFEDKRDEKSAEKEEDVKEKTSPVKTSPGKLQHNLNINVSALMPGAARPKIRLSVARSTSTDETATPSPPRGGASLAPPLVSDVATPTGDHIDEVDKNESGDRNFENLSQTEVLQSATKTRARIPIKRRPSTRRARQEAVRKSMTDFSLYQNEEENASPRNEPSPDSNKMHQSPPTDVKNSFLKDLNNKLGILEGVSKSETSKSDGSFKKSDDSPGVAGISLVFGEQNEQDIQANPVSKGLFDRPPEETEDKQLLPSGILKKESKSTEILRPDDSETSKKEPKPESESILEDSFEDSVDLFKSAPKPAEGFSEIPRKPRNARDLFGGSGSGSSDEDLFSGTKKSVRKDVDVAVDKPSNAEVASRTEAKPSLISDKLDSSLSVDKSSKVEEIHSKAEPKSSLFSDKSDSEGESDLFSGKSKASAAKIGGETSKKVSLFDDSGDSSEEDLFGSKTTKNRGGSEDIGSVLGTRRVESKNVKTAGVKKLENKEVTDFDPLSALD